MAVISRYLGPGLFSVGLEAKGLGLEDLITRLDNKNLNVNRGLIVRPI